MIYFEVETGNIAQAQWLPTVYKTITATDGTASQVVDMSNQPTWATNSFDDTVTDAVSALHDPAHWTYVNSAWTYTAPTDAELLAQAQQVQISQLEAAYNATLNGGFTSSASGTALTYGFTTADQANLNQEATMMVANATTWPIEWQTPNGAVVSLTQAQFTQLLNNGQSFKWAQVKQLRALIGQVQAAASVSAVQAIVWAAATY